MRPYIEATWGWDENDQRRRQQEEFVALPYEIVEANGQPIGTLIVKRTLSHFYLSGLYLLPEHQRQGYGSRLLEGLLAEGQAHHLPVRLRVLRVNPQARRLYERMGFAAVDEEECFMVMEKLPEKAMSEEHIAVTVESVSINEGEGIFATYFVTLQDGAERRMRVYIGKCEGQALALGLQNQSFDRPLTYEAMLAALAAAGASVEEVYIHDVREETLYALVSLRVGSQLQSVDMRPSDALNLAVRAKRPLFVSKSVFLACQHSEAPTDVHSASEIRSVTVPKAAEELATMSSAAVSEELARLFTEDQSDRKVPSIDWKEAGPRDAARLARVKQFYQGGALQAGMDFFHAAMILQHSSSAEDHLLAHEFCVVALSHGVEQAKWLAAASEDRFLMNIGRPQRFGTQYQIPKPHGGWSLYEVSTEVEDSLRSALNVPSLFQAQAYADDMNEKPE